MTQHVPALPDPDDLNASVHLSPVPTTPEPDEPNVHVVSSQLPIVPAKAATIPLDKHASGSQNTDRMKIKMSYAVTIFFIAIVILIFASPGNPSLAIFLTGILGLLSSSIFESNFSRIIQFFDRLLEHFVKVPPQLGRWLLYHKRGIFNVAASVTAVFLIYAIFPNAIGTTINDLNESICLKTPAWFACNSGIGVTSLPHAVRVGLITNNDFGPFDQTSLNGEEKQVESLIFQENNIGCSSTHMTLAIVTMLSRTVEDASSSADTGLEDLRGAFLAQKDYNKAHPAVKLCLIIANLGTLANADKGSSLVASSPASYSLPLVIQQLVQFARYDASFHGIVGFPYSTSASEAIKEIQSSPFASLPIISPSASGDQLSNIPNFYRIVSPDQSQSKIIAHFFCSYLIPNQRPVIIDIFTDDSDVYSQSLHLGFEDSLKQCPNSNQFSIVHDAYKNGDASSIQDSVKDAIKKHVNYIFFPGYNIDLDTLETQLQADQSRSNLTLLGGDGLYDSKGNTHYSFFPIYSTIFTSPLKKNPSLNPFLSQEFMKEYSQYQFPLSYIAQSIPSYVLFPPHVILAYDATTAFTKSLAGIVRGFKQSELDNALQSVSFNGISGYIAFQGTGTSPGHISDPNVGYVYIMCTDRYHTIHLVAQYSNTNTNNFAIQQEIAPHNLCS